jgi:hypothetical protein
MARFKFISLIALVAGPFLLVTNYQETTEKQRIDREGVATWAIPLSKSDSRGRKGSHTYKVDMQVQIPGAKAQNVQVNVSRELYDRVDSVPELKVKFLKEDPTKVIVVGERLEKPEMYGAGAVVTAVGVFGTWWNFLRKKRDANVGAPVTA